MESRPGFAYIIQQRKPWMHNLQPRTFLSIIWYTFFIPEAFNFSSLEFTAVAMTASLVMNLKSALLYLYLGATSGYMKTALLL